jgi:hypothetical protein
MSNLLELLKSHTNSAKGIFVTLMGWAGASQLPGVQKIIQPLIARHPHLDTLVWSLTAVGFLLLNPRVQGRVKTLTGIDLAAEEQKLEQSKQNIQSVQADLKQAGQQANKAMPQEKKP